MSCECVSGRFSCKSPTALLPHSSAHAYGICSVWSVRSVRSVWCGAGKKSTRMPLALGEIAKN